jgi:hypothetical protein
MDDAFQAYTDRLNRGDRWKRRLHDQDRERQSEMLSSSALRGLQSKFTSFINERHDEITGRGTQEEDVVNERLRPVVDEGQGDEPTDENNGMLIL